MAAARNATLVCSLHQVELARAHFPRIVGLRNGSVVFDAPREAVSDAMIEALYRNAEPEKAQPESDVLVSQVSQLPPVSHEPGCL